MFLQTSRLALREHLTALIDDFTPLQDLPKAMSAGDVADKLGLHSLRQRQWKIQSTCALSGEGLYEGLDWLSSKLVKS